MRRLLLFFLVAFLGALMADSAFAETIKVPNTRPVSVKSKTVLDPKLRYVIVAKGRVSDWPDAPEDGFGVDAIWCYAKWRCGSGEPWRQLRVKLDSQQWGSTWGKGLDEFAGRKEPLPYRSSHVYSIEVTGLQGRLEFATWDAFVLRSHPGNKGAFTVEITPKGPEAELAFNFFARTVSSFSPVSYIEAPSGLHTLRGKDLGYRTRLTPTNPTRFVHADGQTRLTLEVVTGTHFADTRNREGGRVKHVFMTIKVVRSNDPGCPVGRRGSLRLFDITYPGSPRPAAPVPRDAIELRLCSSHQHDFEEPRSEDVDVVLVPYVNLPPSKRPPPP